MDSNLLKKARFNTGLLAIQFLISTVTSAVTGSTILAVIAALATAFTVRDALELHKAIKGE